MKAMVIRECGPPEVMRLEEISTPTPGPGEVLIRVHAVSVNRTLDLAVRAGTYAVRPTLPHILGVDPSGVIAVVGAGVVARHVGDRVVTRQIVRPATASQGPGILGVHAWGGYAEYVKVHADTTHPIPAGLDFVTATVVARHAPRRERPPHPRRRPRRRHGPARRQASVPERDLRHRLGGAHHGRRPQAHARGGRRGAVSRAGGSGSPALRGGPRPSDRPGPV